MQRLRSNQLYPLILLVLICGVLGWILFAPGAGVFSLYQKYRILEKNRADTEKLVRENSITQQEIDSLQDDEVLEEIARTKANLTRKGEYIYEFPAQQKKK